MQEGQVMSSSATTKAFIDNETTKDEALNFIASPWYWRHEAITSWSDFDCYKIIEPIIPWSTFHRWLSKTFDAYSVISIIPSIIFSSHTRFLRPKLDAHRMYAQDQVVIRTVKM
jgi:hypothetical protein